MENINMEAAPANVAQGVPADTERPRTIEQMKMQGVLSQPINMPLAQNTQTAPTQEQQPSHEGAGQVVQQLSEKEREAAPLPQTEQASGRKVDPRPQPQAEGGPQELPQQISASGQPSEAQQHKQEEWHQKEVQQDVAASREQPKRENATQEEEASQHEQKQERQPQPEVHIQSAAEPTKVRVEVLVGPTRAASPQQTEQRVEEGEKKPREQEQATRERAPEQERQPPPLKETMSKAKESAQSLLRGEAGAQKQALNAFKAFVAFLAASFSVLISGLVSFGHRLGRYPIAQKPVQKIHAIQASVEHETQQAVSHLVSNLEHWRAEGAETLAAYERNLALIVRLWLRAFSSEAKGAHALTPLYRTPEEVARDEVLARSKLLRALDRVLELILNVVMALTSLLREGTTALTHFFSSPAAEGEYTPYDAGTAGRGQHGIVAAAMNTSSELRAKISSTAHTAWDKASHMADRVLLHKQPEGGPTFSEDVGMPQSQTTGEIVTQEVVAAPPVQVVQPLPPQADSDSDGARLAALASGAERPAQVY